LGFASIPLADTKIPRSCPASRVEFQFIPVQVVKGFSQVIDQCFLLSCIDYHIIDIYLEIVSNLLTKPVLHHTLVSGSCVLQTERRDLIAKDYVWCNKCYFLFVFNCHLDLVIPEYASRKESLAQPAVEYLIYPGEWEGILRTMFIECCVINTDASDVGVFLGNDHRVRYPTRCFDLFDEPGVFNAMKFSSYGFALWPIKPSERLLYGK
jgi:hypothetical protein